MCPRGVVYNLEVEGTHTYRVGAAGLVAHNCHHAGAKSYVDIMERVGAYDETSGVRSFGVTATMYEEGRKHRGLGDVWQKVVIERDIVWAITHGPDPADPHRTLPVGEGGAERGWLVVPEALSVVVDHLDLSKVKTKGGDFREDEVGEMVAQDADQIADAWVEHASHRAGSTVGFFPTKESVEAQRAAFERRNVSCEVVVADTSEAQRGDVSLGTGIYGRLARRETRVMLGLMVPTEGWDCLDEETEILTVDGWRGLGRVDVGNMVQSLNRETGLMEAVPVTRYVERPMRPGERMFTARSQHVDIRTSEGHEFHVRSRWSRAMKTATGAELAQRRTPYSLPLAAESAAGFPGVPLTDDELRFVAWFMTDGGFAGTKIEISQANDYRDEIRALLTRLGFDFIERVRQRKPGAYPNGKPLHVFTVPKGTHGGSLRRSGWAHLTEYLDKGVSPALGDMTRAQFDVFWAELLKGDGDRAWLTCDRQSQVDAYTAMAVTRGLSASYKTRTSANGCTWFRVAVRDRRWLTSDPSDSRSAKLALEEPRDGERVWCVTNRNSTLVTRRGGKIAIIGNCPPVDTVLWARPTKIAGLAIQAWGRGLRPSPGKDDCLILDVVGGTRNLSLVSPAVLLPTIKIEEAKPRPCQRCGNFRKPTDRFEPRCVCAPVERSEIGDRRDLRGLKDPIPYEPVDMVGRALAESGSGVLWLQTRGGTSFIPAGQVLVVLQQEPAGTWKAGVVDRDDFRKGQRLISGVSIEEARHAAEYWATSNVEPTYWSRHASWRKKREVGSPGQLRAAAACGIADPETYTKAALSDLLSIRRANRRLDRR